MRIRINERTKVAPDVADFIIETTHKRMQREAEKITGRYVSPLVRRNALRWHTLACGDVDKVIGTMHGLPYEKIEIVAYKNEVYLSGLTRDITMLRFEGDGARTPDAEYDIGKYMVCIPQEAFLIGTYSGVHLIPARDRKERYRHPHHTGYGDSDNPMDRNAHICSGGFGSIALELIRSLDYAETLRTWVTFLSRYNPRSPLCSPAPFMKFLRYL